MENRRRVILANILLAVFLPVLLLSSVHVHHSITSPDDYCSLCGIEFHHSHISSPIVEHQCIFCKFLATIFLTATAYSFLSFIKLERVIAESGIVEIPTNPIVNVTSRGPPCIG